MMRRLRRLFFFLSDALDASALNCCPFSAAASLFSRWASKSTSRMFKRLAILAPSALACVHPPYVNGGSYGVGEVRCQCLSTESSRVPCLRDVVSEGC